jgi:quercetin dioxygenase-like cupin family protein
MDQKLLYPDWRDNVAFSDEGPQPAIATLLETDKLTVIIGGLQPGHKIPVHPEALAMYHFLEGTGWMTVDEERFAVEAGATVIVPAGAARGMEAETRLAFLATRVT